VLDAVGGADRAQQAVLADRVDGVARDGGGVDHPVLRVVAPAQFAGERVLTKRRGQADHTHHARAATAVA
jgi:hypothetical protein